MQSGPSLCELTSPSLQYTAAVQRWPGAQVLSLQQQLGDESAAWEARLAEVQDTLAARDRAATALERELALRPTYEQARCDVTAAPCCAAVPGTHWHRCQRRLPGHDATAPTTDVDRQRRLPLRLGPRYECVIAGPAPPPLPLFFAGPAFV